jgi:hypothetical protein
MSHAVGDEVWLAWVCTKGVDEIDPVVTTAKVAAVVDGTLLFHRYNSIRERYSFEIVCDSEAEAWAACAQQIEAIRERVQVAADKAAAKAASYRVGEAVAS